MNKSHLKKHKSHKPSTDFQVRDGIHSPDVIRISPDEAHIVDFGGIYSSSLKERKAIGKAFKEAFMGPGYLILKNHQFPISVINRAHTAMREFFSLPLDEKMRCHYLDWPNHRGYVPIKGINADHSLKGGDISEAIEMAHDLTNDAPDHLAGIRFYGPNNWPDKPESFRWALGTYFDTQLELGFNILKAFEYALETEEGFFTSKYTKPLSRTRVCYYPPQSKKTFDISHIGIGAHTDYECFTTVWQDSEGLQMLGDDGCWRLVPSIPGTFAVNLGDLMQMWTNDMFKSTLHRVINTNNHERYSLVQFFGVDYHVVVESLKTCVSERNPSKYQPIKAGTHSENMVSATYHYDDNQS